MRVGKIAGIAFSFGGLLLGFYTGLLPVLSGVASGQMTSHQAGVNFAILGLILGVSLATMDIILNRPNASA